MTLSGLLLSSVVLVVFVVHISVNARTIEWPNNNFTHISAGTSHTCSVLSDAAYCWGSNANGQLGNNSTTQSLVPVAVDVSGVLNGKTVTAISAGNAHTCAVASSIAYCWGSNANGQLGNNSTTQSLVPVAVDVSGVLNGKTVTAIDAGNAHTCAVASGLATCWGVNTSGQLGNSSTTQSLVPVAVNTTGVLNGKTVTAISAGTSHSCTVASSVAACWGSNTNGRLGNNSTTQSTVPVAVNTTGVLNGKTVTAIDAGSAQSCTVASSVAACWGINTNGRLGNNSTTQSLVPVAVDTNGVLNGRSVTAITTGNGHSCAVASSVATCWGLNTNAQLGNQSLAESRVPAALKNYVLTTQTPYRLFANTDSITPGATLAGSNQPASLSSSGDAFRLRTGVTTNMTISAITAISAGSGGAGDYNSCAIANELIYCWGGNKYGQIGDKSASTSFAPTPTYSSGVLAGKTPSVVSVGDYHSCAVASGAAYCWGWNASGQLGNNSTAQSLVPVTVDVSGALAGKTVTAISATTNHTCVIASDAPYCWGGNTYGQLGNNSKVGSTTPVAVDTTGVLAGKTVTAIAAGEFHTCVIASGAAYCWGDNFYGQLGDNYASGPESLVPVAVDTSGVLGGKTVTKIAAAHGHVCAAAADAAYCWGDNTYGQLGNNSTTNSDFPVAVNTSGVLSGKMVTTISMSTQHSCVIASGQAFCWGLNGPAGRLGNNSTTQSLVPVAVDTSGVLSGKTLTFLVANQHSCVISGGASYCWGDNSSGSYGNNTNAASLVPVATALSISIPIQSYAATFKLMYAQKSASSCAAQTSGFVAVTTTSAIAWNTNANVTNGTAISSHSDDPTVSTDTAYQTYVSGGNSFTNTVTIPAGNHGLWDFSLKDNSGLMDTAYCLKIIYTDDSDVEKYAYSPEVVTAAAFSLAFVDNVGTAIVNPAFAMSATNISANCQTVTGRIGIASGNRMRIGQGSPGNGWSVSIAATGGATSSWARTDNGAYYDFNDSSGSPAGCNSGSDGDGLAGQLSVAANTANVTPQSGCTTTGLSLGSGMTGFSQGAIDTLTLITSSSASDPNCYWDVSEIEVSQVIPGDQAQGAYELQLTATVVAQ